ncbi:helix-turn-helix domain-containing protein [Actinomadura hibisca]|uniref:helix-turn-helix domain-containing protein n=1 Tax=Actinomadura hibisca TaxID=68565 RepID=UPI00082A8991|nr:helix-turn-helix transcriptional regulator [Actinomadura hibisca]
MATVRHRRLARELRRLREGAGLRPAAVARDLGWDRSKISRIETARTKPREADVAALLAMYGCTGPHRDELLALARDARRRDWWAAFGEVFDGTFVALEDQAAEICSWQPQTVPGLLQTEEYARAVITAARGCGPEEAHRHVQARMARRPLLGRPSGAPHLDVVLDEAVVRRVIGGPDVMREQLSELWAAAHRPNVTVRILPFSAGAHAGVDGRFVLLGFAHEDDPDVAYIESAAGDLYPESAEEVTRLRLAWERLRGAALSPKDSAAFLAELSRE